MTDDSLQPDATLTVLHILGPLRRSGAEMMLLQVLDQLRDREIRTIVVSMDGSSESEVADEFKQRGADVLQFSSVSEPRMVSDLMRLLRSTRPDCVHVHAERASLLTMCLPALMRIRVVRTVHSAFGFRGSLRTRKQIERQIARLARVRFVAVSPSVQTNEQERFSNPCQLILNWFDERRYRPPSDEMRQRARRLLDIDPHVPVIATVGNCSKVKNHALLITAMAGMTEQQRPLLLHVGDDGGLGSERELATELSVDRSIRFLGSVADVATVLHAADLFVMPSRYEGLGVAAVEALATGLHVVATDVPGLRDLPKYTSGVTLVEPESEALRLEIVRELGEEPRRWRTAGAGGGDRSGVRLGARHRTIHPGVPRDPSGVRSERTLTIGIAGPISLMSLVPLVPDYTPMTNGLGSPVITDLVDAIHTSGHAVRIFTLSTDPRDVGDFVGERLTLHVRKYRERTRWRDGFHAERKCLADAMGQHPCDIIHAHWTYEFALAARKSPTPCLITAHDWGPQILKHHRHPYRVVRLGMQWQVLRREPFLTANSPYIAESIHKWYRRDIPVVPNGIVVPDQLPAMSSAQLGTIGSVNNGFGKLKNTQALLQAFSLLRRHRPDVTLRLVGSDYQNDGPAHKWARTRGLDIGVEFIGSIPSGEIPGFMRSIDLLVHPSLEESFGMTLLEAIIQGTPVIGGDRSGAVPWVLGYGVAGTLVDVTDPDAICHAILDLPTDRTERDDRRQARPGLRPRTLLARPCSRSIRGVVSGGPCPQRLRHLLIIQASGCHVAADDADIDPSESANGRP